MLSFMEMENLAGQNARTKEELIEQIQEGKWNDLLRRVKIKPGDFFYVPSGTIHALCEGTLVLETQQSSDTTYRVYDYDRRDAKGNLRELHLEKAIEVTAVLHQDAVSTKAIKEKGNTTITTYVESEFFSVYKWEVGSKSHFSFNDHYVLFSVINGDGKLTHNGKQYGLKKGSYFIIPFGFGKFEVDGTCEMIVSHT